MCLVCATMFSEQSGNAELANPADNTATVVPAMTSGPYIGRAKRRFRSPEVTGPSLLFTVHQKGHPHSSAQCRNQGAAEHKYQLQSECPKYTYGATVVASGMAVQP